MDSSRPSTEQKRVAFRALHQSGTFVMPNPWDVGSARLLQHLGFAALASTSAGFSWSHGRPDYALELPAALDHLCCLCAAVDVPVNADFQSGFAREPEAVADNVRLALETGVAGVSIEDTAVEDASRLYDLGLAVERIRAAQAAITSAGANVVLVARTELLLHEPQALQRATEKLVAFADAGADCLFAPGVHEREHIATLVRAVAPKPLNVVMGKPGLSVAELAELGVRRISVGGALARVAWAAMLEAAKQMQSGSFAGLATGTAARELNAIFGSF